MGRLQRQGAPVDVRVRLRDDGHARGQAPSRGRWRSVLQRSFERLVRAPAVVVVRESWQMDSFDAAAPERLCAGGDQPTPTGADWFGCRSMSR